MAVKPSIPKGTRDFSPSVVAQRNYIFSTIKAAFELFGFQPIETPAFENSTTLMGKYGEEGDRLIFKILNSGDYLDNYNTLISLYIFNVLKFYKKDFNKNRENEEYYKNVVENFENQTGYIADVIKSNNSFEKIPKDELKEITSLIVEGVNKIGINSFLEFTDEKIFDLTKIIFSDFYLRVKSKYLTKWISEKALRYDLTVPFARYVVQHQNDIVFPFKRYQMQPVWRADRPQKGRFREFYQCDADVVGSKSLWQEVSFVQLYDAVFTKLKFSNTVIKLNNRKILSGIAEIIGAKDKLIDFTVALDKLDKIGVDGVTKEMLGKGINQEAIDKLQPLFNLKGSNQEKLAQLQDLLANSEEGLSGVKDLQFVSDAIEEIGLQSANLEIDVTLARGLNYYTGAIYEVEIPEVKIGSVGGGGRYDDLTGIFGLKKEMSGIGISFGLDRIYLALEELNLFDEVVLPKPKALFINFGEKEALYAVKAIKKLRQNGMNVELYPDAVKMKKQFAYTNKRSIPFVVIAGETEIEKQEFTLKNMQSGAQQNCTLEELVQIVKNA